MGARHQLFVVAETRQRYRTLAVVHHQWLSGKRPLERCLHLLDIFRAKANRAPLTQELRAAREHDDSFWNGRDIFQPFPFIATCLTVGCSFDPDAAYQERVHPLPLNTTLDDIDSEEGITVIDISNLDQVKHCFAFLPRQSGVTWPDKVSKPLTAGRYLSRSIKPLDHVSQAEDDSDSASLDGKDTKDDDYTRSTLDTETHLEYNQVVDRFQSYKLMSEEALESVLSSQVTLVEHVLEHDRSNNSQSRSLGDTAMDKVTTAVLKEPIFDIGIFADVQHLPDFKTKLRSKLMSKAQDRELPSSPVAVGCMEVAFSGESHVDLSVFGTLTVQCLVEVASKILKGGNVKSLDLSHLRQLSEANVTRLLHGASRLESLYLLEMPQISLESIESITKEPASCPAEIYHTEILRRPFIQENHTYSKLMSSIKSPSIKSGRNSPVKNILWARVLEGFGRTQTFCPRKADGITIDWPRLHNGDCALEPTLQLAVFPVNNSFIHLTKLVTGLASFLTCNRKIRPLNGLNEISETGWIMAKSFALAPSTPGGPATKVSALPEILFNAASTAAKIVSTIWPLPFQDLKADEWSVVVINEHDPVSLRDLGEQYRPAMITPKTEKEGGGYRVMSMPKFLEDVMAKGQRTEENGVSDLIDYWKSKTDFVEICQREEIDELLPAFKKNLEIIRDSRPAFEVLKMCWDRE
ncbi:MAG: hypothetical protein Q9181_004214 [Wetmoreana brouardii]